MPALFSYSVLTLAWLYPSPIMPPKYFAESSKVVYRAKDESGEKVFDALEWLAAMCSHIPDRGEQMVRYYVGLRKRMKK